MVDLINITIALIVLAASLFINYLIMKAAVSAGIKDSLWNLEVNMRNAVQAGVQKALKEQEQNMQSAVRLGVREALQEIEKSKSEEKNG